jgi:hypothetical protein
LTACLATSSHASRREHAGRRRPASHAGKTLLRLIVGGTRVGTPSPTRCRRPAPRFSCDRDGMLRTAAARPARSRRNADPRAPKAGPTCRIAAACASGIQAEGGNRAEQEFRGAFRAVRSSSREPARTFLAACHMSLQVSSYAPRRATGERRED